MARPRKGVILFGGNVERFFFFFFNSILEEKIEFYSTYFSRFHPWRMVFVIIVGSTERRKGGMILRKEK